MKTIIFLTMLAQAAFAKPFVSGQDVLEEVSGINYDTEWTGYSPKHNIDCRVAVNNYASKYQGLYVTVTHYLKQKTIGEKHFEIKPDDKFVMSRKASKVTFTQYLPANNPYAPLMVIEILYHTVENGEDAATVTLKNGARDIGISCTVSYEA